MNKTNDNLLNYRVLWNILSNSHANATVAYLHHYTCKAKFPEHMCLTDIAKRICTCRFTLK